MNAFNDRMVCPECGAKAELVLHGRATESVLWVCGKMAFLEAGASKPEYKGDCTRKKT